MDVSCVFGAALRSGKKTDAIELLKVAAKRTSDDQGSALVKRMRTLSEASIRAASILEELQVLEELRAAIPTVQSPEASFSVEQVMSAAKAFFDRCAVDTSGFKKSGPGILVHTAGTQASEIARPAGTLVYNVYTPMARGGGFTHSISAVDRDGNIASPGATTRIDSSEPVFNAIARMIRDTPSVIDIQFIFTVSVDLSAFPIEIQASLDRQRGVAFRESYMQTDFTDAYILKTAGSDNASAMMAELAAGLDVDREKIRDALRTYIRVSSGATLKVRPTETDSVRLYKVRWTAAKIDDDDDDDNDDIGQMVVTADGLPSTMDRLLEDVFPIQLFTVVLKVSSDDSSESEDDFEAGTIAALVHRTNKDFQDVRHGRELTIRVSANGDPTPNTLDYTFRTVADRVDADVSIDVDEPPMGTDEDDSALLATGFVRSSVTGRVFVRPPLQEVSADTIRDTMADDTQIVGQEEPFIGGALDPSIVAFMKAQVAVNNLSVLTMTERLGVDSVLDCAIGYMDGILSPDFSDRASFTGQDENQDNAIAWIFGIDHVDGLIYYMQNVFRRAILEPDGRTFAFVFTITENNGMASTQARFDTTNIVGLPSFVSKYVDSPGVYWVAPHGRKSNIEYLSPEFPYHRSLGPLDQVRDFSEEGNRADFVIGEETYASVMQFAQASVFDGFPALQSSFYRRLHKDEDKDQDEAERLLQVSTFAASSLSDNGISPLRQSFSKEELQEALLAQILQNRWMYARVWVMAPRLPEGSKFHLVPFPVLRNHAHLPSTVIMSVETRMSGQHGFFSEMMDYVLNGVRLHFAMSDGANPFWPRPLELNRRLDRTPASGRFAVRGYIGPKDSLVLLFQTQWTNPGPKGIEWVGPQNSLVFRDEKEDLLSMGASPTGMPKVWFQVICEPERGDPFTLFMSRHRLDISSATAQDTRVGIPGTFIPGIRDTDDRLLFVRAEKLKDGSKSAITGFYIDVKMSDIVQPEQKVESRAILDVEQQLIDLTPEAERVVARNSFVKEKKSPIPGWISVDEEEAEILEVVPNDDGKMIKRVRFEEQQDSSASTETSDEMGLDVDGDGVTDLKEPLERVTEDGVETLKKLVAALSVPSVSYSGKIEVPVMVEISDHGLALSGQTYSEKTASQKASTREINAVFLHPGWPLTSSVTSTQVRAHVQESRDSWPYAQTVDSGFIFEGVYYPTMVSGILCETLRRFGIPRQFYVERLTSSPSDLFAILQYQDIVESALPGDDEFAKMYASFDKGRLFLNEPAFVARLSLMQRAFTLQNHGMYNACLQLIENARAVSDQAVLFLAANLGEGIEETPRNKAYDECHILKALTGKPPSNPPYVGLAGTKDPYTATRRLVIKKSPLALKFLKPILLFVRGTGGRLFTDAMLSRSVDLLMIRALVSDLEVAESGAMTISDAADRARAELFQLGVVSVDFTILFNSSGQPVGCTVSKFVDNRDDSSHTYVVMGMQVIGNTVPIVSRLLSHAEHNMASTGYESSSGRRKSTLTGIVVQEAGFADIARPATLAETSKQLFMRSYDPVTTDGRTAYVMDPDDFVPNMYFSAGSPYGRTYCHWLGKEVFSEQAWNFDRRLTPFLKGGELQLERIDTPEGEAFRRVDIWTAVPNPLFVSELPALVTLSRQYPSIRVFSQKGSVSVPQPSTFLAIECHMVTIPDTTADNPAIRRTVVKDRKRKLIYRTNLAPDWVLFGGKVTFLPFENEAARYFDKNVSLFNNIFRDDEGNIVRGETLVAVQALQDVVTEIKNRIQTSGSTPDLQQSLNAATRELADMVRNVGMINNSETRLDMVQTLYTDELKFKDWDPNAVLMQNEKVSIRAPEVGPALRQVTSHGTLKEIQERWADMRNWSDTMYPEPNNSASIALRTQNALEMPENASVLSGVSAQRVRSAQGVNDKRWQEFVDKYSPPQPYTTLDSMLVFDREEPMIVTFSVVEHTYVGDESAAGVGSAFGSPFADPKVLFESEPIVTEHLFREEGNFSKELRMERKTNDSDQVVFVDELEIVGGVPAIQAEGDVILRTKTLVDKNARGRRSDPETIFMAVEPQAEGGLMRTYKIDIPQQNRVMSLSIEYNNNMEVLDDQPERLAIGAFRIQLDPITNAQLSVEDVSMKPQEERRGRKSKAPRRNVILE